MEGIYICDSKDKRVNVQKDAGSMRLQARYICIWTLLKPTKTSPYVIKVIKYVELQLNLDGGRDRVKLNDK